MAGFADVEYPILGPGLTFAIYFERDSLWFSAGSRRWLASAESIQFTHQARLFRSAFRVHVGDSIAFSITYTHVRRTIFSAIDAAYDGIDYDHDYFLAFLADHAASRDWQAGVRKAWLHPDR